MPAITRKPGQIITFYSYKGGTGRSMALANVAWILASNGRRVLAVDWDLEAPGLHRYFAPFLHDRELTESKGLIDLAIDFASAALGMADKLPKDPEWFAPMADVSPLAQPLDYDFPNRGSLELLSAGQQGPLYANRVNSFNWQNFYERQGGGIFFEHVRKKMCEDYEYILIDSRTGVSDTSGICTVQMPDHLVICFTANNQSIEGASAIAADVRRKWDADTQRPRQQSRIFPMMTRVESAESDRLNMRRAFAWQEFKTSLTHLEPGEQESYWYAVEMQYNPYYAYEELLAPFRDHRLDQKSFLPALEKLTAVITDHDVEQLIAPSEADRVKFQARFAARRNMPDATVPATSTPVKPRYDAFLSFAHADQAAVRTVHDRLRKARLNVWFDLDDIRPGQHWQDAIEDAIATSRSWVVFIGPGGLGSLQKGQVADLISRHHDGKRPVPLIPVLLPGADLAKLGDAQLAEELRRFQWIDLRNGLDHEGRLRELVAGIRGVKAKRTPTLAAGEFPYRGSKFYDVEHAGLFFGRDTLVQACLDALDRARQSPAGERFLALVGPSKSGKSSLARAGVLGQLAADALPGSSTWPQVIMSPGARPLENLAAALNSLPRAASTKALSMIPALVKEPATLDQAARTGQAVETPVILLVDAFEELFEVCEDEEARKAFIANLVHASQSPAGKVIVLIALRSDYQRFRGLYPALDGLIARHSIAITPMTRAELREAIEQPARLVSLPVDERALEIIPADLPGQPGMLPLLQNRLMRAFNASREYRLDVDALLAAPDRFPFAKEAFTAVDQQEQAEWLRFLLRFFQAERRPWYLIWEAVDIQPRGKVPLSEFLPPLAAEARLPASMRRLVQSGLVIIGGDPQMEHPPFVELAHANLVRWPRLEQARKENKDYLRAYTKLREAATKWERSGRKDEDLLASYEIDWMRQTVKAHVIHTSPLEATFLETSEKTSTSGLVKLFSRAVDLLADRPRLIQALNILHPVAFLILLFLAVFLYGWSDNVISEAKKIEAGGLEQMAKAKEINDRALTDKKATEDKLADINLANEKLKKAQDDFKAEKQLRLARKLALAALIKSEVEGNYSLGTLLAAEAVKINWDDNKKTPLFVAEQALRRTIGRIPARQFVTLNDRVSVFPQFSADGRWLATSKQVFDLAAPDAPLNLRLFEKLNAGLRNDSPPTFSIDFSPDSQRLALLKGEDQLMLWDLTRSAEVLKTITLSKRPDWAKPAPDKVPEKASTPPPPVVMPFRISNGERWLVMGRNAPPDTVKPKLQPVKKSARFADGTDGFLTATVSLIQADIYKKPAEEGPTLLESVYLWDLKAADQKPAALVTGQVTERALRFSPDGRWLAVGTRADPKEKDTGAKKTAEAKINDADQKERRGGDVFLFDLSNEAPIEAAIPLRRHAESVSTLAFSPGGRWLVTASEDRRSNLVLWDLHAQDISSEPRVLADGKVDVSALEFSPGNDWLAAGFRDGEIQIWSIQKDCVAVSPTVFKPLAGAVTALAFSRDGHWLGAMSEVGRGLIADLSTPLTSPDFYGFDGLRGSRGLAFAPHGRWLANASTQEALLHGRDIDELLGTARKNVSGNLSQDQWGRYFPDREYRPTFPELEKAKK